MQISPSLTTEREKRDEWYAPSEIRFGDRKHIRWLLKHYGLIKSGNWPPRVSGYVDPPGGSKARKRHAYFETPAAIWAELSWRVERTGVEGKLLLAEIEAGRDDLSDEANAALHYVCGWRRRAMPFVDWRRQRRYLDKTAPITTKS